MKKYAKYLIELVVIVAGITLSFMVDEWREDQEKRSQEIKYLKNIKNDLLINIEELGAIIKKRQTQVKSAKLILEYHEGKPLTDLVEFNVNCINVYTWLRFELNSNAFEELVNSGNLALLSNDSIKNQLLELQTVNKKMKHGEDHFRHDSEQLLYDPVYNILDMNPTVKSFMFYVTNGEQGEDIDISNANLEEIVKSLKHKNGMVMAEYEFNQMIIRFEQMKEIAEKLTEMIESEIAIG